MELDPSQLPAGEMYQFIISAIVPRPIAWVSSVGTDGQLNLAPFSYFNGVCSRPPVISIAIGYRRGAKKDTLVNIEATKEFVVNLVSFSLAEAMNHTSGDYPLGVSEAEVAGVKMIPSLNVAPPRVAEASVAFECRLHQLIPIGSAPDGSTLVLGEIVRIHARDEVCQDGKIDPIKLDAVGRMGGSWYCRTNEKFSMERPKI